METTFDMDKLAQLRKEELENGLSDRAMWDYVFRETRLSSDLTTNFMPYLRALTDLYISIESVRGHSKDQNGLNDEEVSKIAALTKRVAAMESQVWQLPPNVVVAPAISAEEEPLLNDDDEMVPSDTTPDQEVALGEFVKQVIAPVKPGPWPNTELVSVAEAEQSSGNIPIVVPRRRRGRPKGSRNKPKTQRETGGGK